MSAAVQALLSKWVSLQGGRFLQWQQTHSFHRCWWFSFSRPRVYSQELIGHTWTAAKMTLDLRTLLLERARSHQEGKLAVFEYSSGRHATLQELLREVLTDLHLLSLLMRPTILCCCIWGWSVLELVLWKLADSLPNSRWRFPLTQAQCLAGLIQGKAKDKKHLMIAIFLDRGIGYIQSVLAALFLR